MKVLLIPGSSRQGSFNMLLAHEAKTLCDQAGHTTTLVDLRELAMPIYDGDLEAAQGLPPGAHTLRAALREHDGLVFVSPEYNSSLPPLLKNALDWASRAYDGVPGTVHFREKTAVLLSASPGGFGGIRCLIHLRQILSALGCLVLPDQFSVSHAGSAFTAEGLLADAKQRDTLQGVLSKLRA